MLAEQKHKAKTYQRIEEIKMVMGFTKQSPETLCGFIEVIVCTDALFCRECRIYMWYRYSTLQEEESSLLLLCSASEHESVMIVHVFWPFCFIYLSNWTALTCRF